MSIRTGRLLSGFVWLLVIGFFTLLMARIVAPYTSGRLDIDFLLSKQHIIYKPHYRTAFYLHIFPALLVLAAGLTQFSAGILRHTPAVHRWVGRAYAFSIVFVCGPAGFVMAWYANGGWIPKSSFLILSVLWWTCTLIAWRAARRGALREHRVWMMRSYALTLSAVTLRLMQYFLAVCSTLDPDFCYQLVAWPSWIINLAIAEAVIRYKKFGKAFPVSVQPRAKIPA